MKLAFTIEVKVAGQESRQRQAYSNKGTKKTCPWLASPRTICNAEMDGKDVYLVVRMVREDANHGQKNRGNGWRTPTRAQFLKMMKNGTRKTNWIAGQRDLARRFQQGHNTTIGNNFNRVKNE